MISPSIQLAPSMNAENISASVHAFETSIGTGASFAEHLDHAVQSSPRPATQPPDSRSTTPKPTSDAPQATRTQVTTARPTVSQTKQNSGAGSKTSTGRKAQNSDAVQKDDEQRQPASVRSKDSRPSDNSRNSGRHQAGDEETPAKDKSPFAQAVAQSAASQSEALSAAQPAETSTQSSDASIPAALLAFLQAAQNPGATTTDSDLNATQADSSSMDDAGSATMSNVFQSLNFGTSNLAYQAALTNFQASVSAAQSASSNGTSSASQPGSSVGSANSLSPADQQTSALSSDSESASTESSTSASAATSDNSNNSVPPSASVPQVAPAVSTDSTANRTAAVTSVSPAANANSAASTVAAASRANVAASAAYAMPSSNGQQAETNPAPAVKSPQAESADPANLIKNLKSDAGQHEAAKPAPEGLTAIAKAKAEPAAAELQQAIANVTVTNHVSSPTLSRQPSASNSQALAASQESGLPAVTATQGSAAGWTDDSTGDSAEDYTSTQTSSASQGSNGSKSSGSAVEFLPSSAFNSDAVGGVAPAAVHAVAAGTLQSNTGFENASLKTPEAAAQNLNAAAQEKAFAAWQSVSAQIGRVVNAATLNALQNGTEMRVQLRTDAFGSMDIRATLEGGKVGAAIGVDSAEAHNALLSQLPALQQSLNERQVQLDQISVVSSYAQSGTDFGTGSGKQNGDPAPSSGHQQQASGSEQVSEPASAPVTEAWQPATARRRLSVQA